MARPAKKRNHTQEIVTSIHAFSNEAFTLAKSFVAGSNSNTLKQKASDLATQLPKIADRIVEVEEAYREDLYRALSEANLDLNYVVAGGGRPSSIRLSQVIREQGEESVAS
jgi:hypothetical protein